jgi:hypothetical protein
MRRLSTIVEEDQQMHEIIEPLLAVCLIPEQVYSASPSDPEGNHDRIVTLRSFPVTVPYEITVHDCRSC